MEKFLKVHYINLHIYYIQITLCCWYLSLLSSDLAYTEGGASSNIKTSPMQEKDSMISPKAMLQEMPPAKKLRTVNPCPKGDAMDILGQIPSVTTTGDGPNGKRIEGLLYKYRRGQVCIVCVCHGSFLSPAEFVMHAGGKEVANPMKHITVCCNSF